MFAIVSIFRKDEAEWITNLWNILEVNCGLVGIKYFPYPHFSWQGSEDYNLDRIQNILTRATFQAQPFKVKTAGLGIFTRGSPVIYITLVKDQPLLDFHRRLWEMTKGLADQPNGYYAPENWIPHITLAILDVNMGKLSCAIDRLGMLDLEKELVVDNLTLVSQTGSQIGELKSQFQFQSK